MKKNATIFLSLVSLALLVSCGGQGTSSETSTVSVPDSSVQEGDSTDSEVSSAVSDTLPVNILKELKKGYSLESKNSVTGYLLDEETKQKVPNSDYTTSYIVDITHVEGEHAYQMYQPVSSAKVLGNAVPNKDKVYQACDYLKGEDGKTYSKTLGIDNQVVTRLVQVSQEGGITSVDYDELGFGNVFSSVSPNQFHEGRNAGSYELDLSTMDEEAARMIGDNLGCSDLSVSDENGNTYYPEMDYFRLLTENQHVTGFRVGFYLSFGTNYIRYDFRGDVIAEGRETASSFFVHSLDDSGKDDLKNRLSALKGKNYTEDFLEYYGQSVETEYSYANQPELLFSSHTKYEFSQDKIRYTRYNEEGKSQTQAFVVMDEDGAGQNVVSVSDKGYYPAGNKQENVSFPDFGISPALFDQVSSDDGGVTYEFLRSKYPYVSIDSSYFSFEASSTLLDRLTITLRGNDVIFHGYFENQAVDGTAWTKLEFQSTFSQIGNTSFAFDVSSIHENGDNLVWSDFFSSDKDYARAKSKFGGDEILNQIPTFGSVYNDPYLVMTRDADRNDTISYRYYLGSIMDYVDYGEGSGASLEKLMKTLTDFQNQYMQRFSTEMFEIEDYTKTDSFPMFAAVLKEEFDLSDRKNVMGVLGRAVFDSNTYSLYYEVLPTVMVAKRSVTFDFNYPSDVGATREPESYDVDDGETVIAPNCGLDGYTFLGWYTEKEGGEEADFTSPIREDVTYYAHWSKNA